MSEKHSYMQMADAYGQTAASTDPRALEARILLKAATKMEHLAQRYADGEKVNFREVGEVMEYNQKLWTLFADDAMNPDHPLPQEIKNNIASLALFTFKRTRDILADPNAGKFEALISINRNIAAGLTKQAALTNPPEQKPASQNVTDSSV